MRELIYRYLSGAMSRRSFMASLIQAGFTAVAAENLAGAAELGEPIAQTTPAAKPPQSLLGTGGELLAEQVRQAGIRFIFCNPGSHEAGFYDALVDRPDLILIEGLHEGIVVSMADGFSRMSRQAAFVNVHAVAGTAQMSGQLYNAFYDGTPLVITAGLVNTSAYSDDVALAPRPGFHQIDINRQFTKMSWDTLQATAVPLLVRRAFKTALTAPGGPVYLCVGEDALEQPGVTGDLYPAESFLVNVRPRPATDQVQALAKMLLDSQRPVAIFGDEVWKSQAQAEAVQLCELLGIPAGGGLEAFANFPTTHPLYIGDFSGGEQDYPDGKADTVVQIGARDWGGADPWPRMPQGARFAAVGIDTEMLGRTEAMNLAVVGDVKATLTDLLAALHSMATPDRLQRLRDSRYSLVSDYSKKTNAARMDTARRNFGQSPIHPDQLAVEMDEALDPNAIIVSENLWGPYELFKFGYRPNEKTWITAMGTSLGWGIGAAMGVKLAAPDRLVVCSIGDGAVMYSASGFWTMRRYDIPVLTVVWNNHCYERVRDSFEFFGHRMKETGKYPGLYIGDPDIDFVKLAESQGVQGERVTAATNLRQALMRGMRTVKNGDPYVVEVSVATVGPGADSKWYQKFSAKARG